MLTIVSKEGTVSLNKLTVDVKDTNTGDVLYTPASETYGGYQVFGGIHLQFGKVGVGGEVKYKRMNSEDYDTLRAASVFVSLSF